MTAVVGMGQLIRLVAAAPGQALLLLSCILAACAGLPQAVLWAGWALCCRQRHRSSMEITKSICWSLHGQSAVWHGYTGSCCCLGQGCKGHEGCQGHGQPAQ